MSTPPTLVIFGASGDLTARKLIPSLYRLFCRQRLPAETRIVGVARTAWTDDAYRSRLAGDIQEFAGKDWNPEAWQKFSQQIFYVPGDAAESGGLERLNASLRQRETREGGGRLYYLAVAPQLYSKIIVGLGEAGMNREDDGWRRLVIEKPFGRDLASARELNRTVLAHFREDQVYRIDHYLGKDTVQNILVFRFANTLFEPIWNHNFIDHVQIVAFETVPVGGRGGYYDQAGVFRDMFQNHLLQLVSLVAMEAPARFEANPFRNEKVKLLDAVAAPSIEEAASQSVYGQYAGYRSEKGVAANSRTPTCAAVRLQIDNWRWQGVPFYLCSGKALGARRTEIVVQFRCPPHLMFPLPPGATLQCNRLSLCIQPDEGIHLNFQTKTPDHNVVLHPADLEFHYRTAYPGVDLPEAYERLLLDAMSGDATLFMRSDDIERAWAIMDPFIAAAERPDAPLPEEYAVGSKGPSCIDALIAREGRSWASLCEH